MAPFRDRNRDRVSFRRFQFSIETRKKFLHRNRNKRIAGKTVLIGVRLKSDVVSKWRHTHHKRRLRHTHHMRQRQRQHVHHTHHSLTCVKRITFSTNITLITSVTLLTCIAHLPFITCIAHIPCGTHASQVSDTSQASHILQASHHTLY